MSAPVSTDTAIASSEHLGLTLARYLPFPQANDTQKAKDRLLAAVAGDGQRPGTFSEARHNTPPGYEAFVARWQRAHLASPHVRVLTLQTTGRVVIGLGLDTPLENGLTTHHTYGVPVLPGSALKGLCASFARRHYEGWTPDVEDGPYRNVFGFAPPAGRQGRTTQLGAAGLVRFADALPVPRTWALHREVMTTHHQGYYTAAQPSPPSDWDEPIPVPFVSVSGQFMALLTADPHDEVEAALDAACALLTVALAEDGLGAKTSSGFGRFTVQVQPRPSSTSTASPATTLPSWITAVLNAKWSRGDLMNRGGKVQDSARRLVRESEEGTLPKTEAQAAAKGVLQLYAAFSPKDMKEFAWFKALRTLAEPEQAE